MRTESSFDVLVIGGGHAGAEAAVAAARLGCRVALVTSVLETIGQMSCNPAIGGVAKGTVVREVDALGGVMGRATDDATIQFRMLNRGKGPAVWAPRAQADRGLYRRAVRALVERHANVTLIQGTVAQLLIAQGRVTGVETLDNRRFGARAVVVTTGTFGRGKIHIGTTTQLAGGRAGEAATTHLAEQLAEVGLEVQRFKTGTPPRIDGRSVDYSKCEPQLSELADFSYRWSHFGMADGGWRMADGGRQGAAGAASLPQVPCYITFAGAEVKALVGDSIELSAMYGGAIGSRGPRYCPSIEDKVVRFPDAERHQIFLEPEGLDTHELYVNGLSTSLPADVQLRMLRAVPGLEQVQMTRAGYAIEYDYYPPTQLELTLAVRQLPGLYLAGQINGTTGYEEAAGQGLMAGLNAALAVTGRAPLVLGRDTSYVAVLVDDIVARGVDEPYRLFTSRSEFRLTVRQDNALRRLAPIGRALGLYTDEEQRFIDARLGAEDRAAELAATVSVRPEQVAALLERIGSSPIPHSVKIAELARRQEISLGALFDAAGVEDAPGGEAVVTAELELKYTGYFAREREAAERMRRMGDFVLSTDLPYEEMKSLSTEARQKLRHRRPSSLAMAARIPGVSPADLQNLVLEVERRRRRGPASESALPGVV
ncbi:MAG TPA: tRNA uridine-5-carboxymethylaminomethyl(34) synthesis enzyme MnmG [Gemmatimonadaceae bacterium]|jgi:tRNA uridine 5-carboxymethylaminomethyl modification enzyme